MTSHACITWDDTGKCYTGGSNSKIYVWDGAGGRQAQATLGGHGRGFVCSLIWRAGKLYSGGKDGNVVVTDSASQTVEATISFDNLIRAIDVNGAEMVVGLRNGTIFRCASDGSNQRKVMESHCDGEIWGLGVVGDKVVTTADDNQLKIYDTSKRCCVSSGKVSDENRTVKCGASSLSKMPSSKCSRAAAISPSSGHVALGCNDGTF
jgi:WD40 repeat protein